MNTKAHLIAGQQVYRTLGLQPVDPWRQQCAGCEAWCASDIRMPYPGAFSIVDYKKWRATFTNQDARNCRYTTHVSLALSLLDAFEHHLSAPL
eukprot:1678797-Amphidinium_carterae.1